MEVDAAGEGVARVSAVVSEEVLNHHELAHGAFVFAVADVAFALAVNSVTDSVAVQWSLSLFRPALLGERITADCSVIHRGRRLMVVDLEVHNSAGKLLAKGQATALREDSSAVAKGVASEGLASKRLTSEGPDSEGLAGERPGGRLVGLRRGSGCDHAGRARGQAQLDGREVRG